MNYFLQTMDDVIDYLKENNNSPIVMVFNSPEEYYDFVKKYNNNFFRKYYDFCERFHTYQIHKYSPFGLRLDANVNAITDRMSSWAYCSYQYYKDNGYQFFAIYSELSDSRKIESATDQEVSDFLFTEN